MAADPPLSCDPRFCQLDQISSPVFVLETDQIGEPRYVAFNAFARQISGRPLSDYIGRTAAEIYGGSLGRTARERHREVAASRRTMTYEIDLPLAGTQRSVRTTLVPVPSDDGESCLLYGTSIDLTQERSTHEARVTFDTIATEMEQFIAMAAHDLRAPMRNMAQIAQLLRDDFVDHGDGKAELIDLMEEVAAKSMALITDVLNHAHAVDVSDTTCGFNFAALCRDICDVLDPHGQHRFTYPSVEISGDRTTFQIGMRNLIDNALKYGGRDSLNVDVSLTEGAPGMLDIVLTDDGAGFDTAALEFLNGGRFRTDSGYGLLGVRRMVLARGGKLTAGNRISGPGAVVRFSLPGQWIGLTHSLGDTEVSHVQTDTPRRHPAA